MSAIRVTAARTMGRARNLVSTAFVFWGFLAVVALFFAFGLESAEGGELPVSVIWTSAVSYVLPALAALLSMDVWSEERQTGRIEPVIVAVACVLIGTVLLSVMLPLMHIMSAIG